MAQLRQLGREQMALKRLGQFNPGPLDPDPLQRLIDETSQGEQSFLGAVDVSGAVVAHGPSGGVPA